MVTKWTNDPKRGEGAWNYNQVGIEYNSLFESIYTLEVTYNGLGITTDWVNQQPETLNN